MHEDKIKISTPPSAIAIAQEESGFKAVELRKKGGAFEVLWAKSSKGTDTNWRLFAAECGLPTELTVQADLEANKIVVVGFNSAGVAFYRISVPAVEKEEIAAIVKLQAETQLPLPAQQMELAWRVGQGQDGQVPVTIAAARKEQLQRFVENVRDFEPTKIVLDCEGIIEAWRTFFPTEGTDAVVVSMAKRSTQVCLAEDGRLSNAVVLDIGEEDLAEQAETIERFIQDMRSVLDLFGYADSAKLPVFVLSDGSAAYVGIVSSLRSEGLNARAASPDINKLKAQTELQAEDLYEYRVPIGLALMALEARTKELNIFERLYKPARKGEKKHWLYSPKVTCAIASVLLVLLVVVAYAVDVASPGAIEKRLEASLTDTDMEVLMERQTLIKTIASQRPDLLDLINQVVESGDRGIKLESLYFKKGQRVTINGQAPGNEQLYRFEKSLQDRTSIKDVKMTSTRDTRSSNGSTRGRGLNFTITFHYRNFTK